MAVVEIPADKHVNLAAGEDQVLIDLTSDDLPGERISLVASKVAGTLKLAFVDGHGAEVGVKTGATTGVIDTATQAQIDAAVTALVNGAPGALDTLNELATALNDDASFAATVNASIAAKQPLDSDLTAIAALTTTAYGRALLALADAAALRSTAGLGTAAQSATTDFDAAGAATTAAAGKIDKTGGGKETVSTQATASGAVTLNLANGNVHDLTLTGNVSGITVSNATNGVSCSFTLILRQDATGSRTVAWMSGVKWAGAVAPTISTGASKVDVLTFVSVDGGTTWLGFAAGIDLR